MLSLCCRRCLMLLSFCRGSRFIFFTRCHAAPPAIRRCRIDTITFSPVDTPPSRFMLLQEERSGSADFHAMLMPLPSATMMLPFSLELFAATLIADFFFAAAFTPPLLLPPHDSRVAVKMPSLRCLRSPLNNSHSYNEHGRLRHRFDHYAPRVAMMSLSLRATLTMPPSISFRLLMDTHATRQTRRSMRSTGATRSALHDVLLARAIYAPARA